jgi:REP element-mobilizing transposase RayT
MHIGEIIGAEMRHNDASNLVCELWLKMAERFPSVALGEFVVMPNHLHGLVRIENQGATFQLRLGSSVQITLSHRGESVQRWARSRLAAQLF